jgi:hypothetical protein
MLRAGHARPLHRRSGPPARAAPPLRARAMAVNASGAPKVGVKELQKVGGCRGTGTAAGRTGATPRRTESRPARYPSPYLLQVAEAAAAAGAKVRARTRSKAEGGAFLPAPPAAAPSSPPRQARRRAKLAAAPSSPPAPARFPSNPFPA